MKTSEERLKKTSWENFLAVDPGDGFQSALEGIDTGLLEQKVGPVEEIEDKERPWEKHS